VKEKHMRGKPAKGTRDTYKLSLIKKVNEKYGVDLPLDPNEGVYVKTHVLEDWLENGFMGVSASGKTKVEKKREETEKEVDSRIAIRFRVLDTMIQSCIKGDTRSLIVSGPAGLGKSYNVEQALRTYDPKGDKYTIIKGYSTPANLLIQLWDHRTPGSILVFDDCDSVFGDERAMSLLKAACDTTEDREICYMSTGSLISDKDASRVDKKFYFGGTIIFLTNVDFDYQVERGSQMSPHFEALQSRSQYIDLAMKTRRDYHVRIKQVADAGLLDDLGPENKKQVLDFLAENRDEFRELSIRMAIKLGILLKSAPTEWRDIARITCFKNT
jgi:hypothetical protein